MVRKFVSEIVSGVRDGIAWGLFAVALSGGGFRLSFRRRHHTPLRSSPPWDSVVTRTQIRAAELRQRGRL